MLLLIHTKSHPICISLIIWTLLVGILRTAYSEPFPTPQIVSAGGQCPETVVSWTNSGMVPFYVLIVLGPQGAISQVVFGTQFSFIDLAPGNYNAMVKAGSLDENDSDFSPMFPFTVAPCITCVQPTVQVSYVNPSILWPPNGRSIPVKFAGNVTGITSACPLTQATFTVKDSQGSSRQGQVYVAGDGTFAMTLSLAARRAGNDDAGRVYTYSVHVANNVGTATSSPVRVEVPHDQGQ